MEEQLISFETAKSAKEKGWEGDFVESHKILTTQSLLQKWLREVHNIQVTIEFWNASSHNHKWKIQFHDEKVKINKTIFGDYCESYEDALEQGLQEALKQIKE